MFTCGEAISQAHCLPSLETIYGFDSRGKGDVTRDVTSDVMSRQNFPQNRVTSEMPTDKKLAYGRAWGAQPKKRGAQG